MKKTLVALFLLLGMLLLSACGGNTDTDTETSTESDTATEIIDSSTESTTETETEVESETDIATDTETDSDAETDTNTEAVDTSTETEVDSSTATETETEVDSDTDTETNTGSDTETDTNTEVVDTSTDTATDTETESETETDTATDTTTDTEAESDTETEREKYGNQVHFTYEEKENIYYTEIIDFEETDTPIDFPEEEFPQKKTYAKIIDNYEDLSKYISNPNLDESIFDDNYVVCIKKHFSVGSYDGIHKNSLNLIGYYDFVCVDGKYEISLDFYYSVIGEVFPMVGRIKTFISYIVVPKAELPYVEDVQEIEVTQRQINGNNGLGGISLGDPNPPQTNTHFFIGHNKDTELPETPKSWVIENYSELGKQLGLIYDELDVEGDYNVILYLPAEPEYDFIITGKEIKDGDLYLTVESYTKYTNDYLAEKDIKFYDLYIKDSTQLSDNYNIYITVNKITVPTVPESPKYANSVSLEYFEKENIYYTSIENVKETNLSMGFPKDEERDSFTKYMKMINSYEEFKTYISEPAIDESIFEENYVLCIKQYVSATVIGYHGFSYENGKYSISLDVYQSKKPPAHEDIGYLFPHDGYLIVPRSDIPYTEEVQKINVKINYTSLGGSYYWFVGHDANAELPDAPASWVVKNDSEIQKQFGLTFVSTEPFTVETRVVLYLPTEPEYDFVITKEEIKDGDLYLTLDAYINHRHYYLKKNDVKFYDLGLGSKCDLLSDNYNIYITVNKITVPVIE